MDVEVLRLLWEILNTLLSLGVLLLTWLVKRGSAQKAELDGMNTRLTRIEERVSHLPTDHDLSEMGDRMSRLEARLSELLGEQKAMTRLVERIDEYLRERER